MKALYTALATAHGGREGHVRSSDGLLEADLRLPKEMGGPGGAGTNPEQLFAAGYAACFESALRLVARMQKAPLADAHITARVTLNATEDKKYVLSVELEGKLDGVTHDDALALMRAAHEVCPYSNATRGNIDVKLSAS
ncbi:MAG TPA: organic hydroperoxide resistance protein [Polyangiaceae bacterium]|jgi:Ohr subfamily peroxiredoxin|nr:organic hydroperoxide resistance protein [Polyangiaceae bacterium]